MSSTLVRKLENFARLPDEVKEALKSATRDVRTFAPRQDIIEAGDKPVSVHLIVEGWAVRYKVLPGGERPIMAFLIPGDLCDVQITLLDQMDHSIGTLSACKVALIPRDEMHRLMQEHPHLSRALWWATLVDEAILREWLVNQGHRPADKRVAHLICEMLVRSQAVGLTDDNSFDMPVTQEELADTMGITPNHMNRTLQALRGSGIIASKGKQMIVNDRDRLIDFAGFDPIYLHQQGVRTAKSA